MLILIHGDNIDVSRDELNLIKKPYTGQDLITLNGKSLDELTLVNAIETNSLLFAKKLVVIENLLSNLNLKFKKSTQIINRISDIAKSQEIVLWEGKEIDQIKIRKLPAEAQIKLYKFPVIIFQFLDQLTPGNQHVLLPLLSKLLSYEPAEIIMSMVVRRVRQLIMALDGVAPQGMAEWQLSRLTNQAKSFNLNKLVNAENSLLLLETSLKSGRTPYTLTVLLTKFVIDL